MELTNVLHSANTGLRRGEWADVSPPALLFNSAQNYKNNKVNIDRRFEEIMLVACSDKLRVNLNPHVCINPPAATHLN